MKKNISRRRYARIKPENLIHARGKGIRTTTVDLAEIARSSVSGDLSAKSSKQVNHAPEEGTNGLHNLCRAASLSAGKRAIWTAESNSIPKNYQTRGGSKEFAQMYRKTNERQTATAGDKFLAH